MSNLTDIVGTPFFAIVLVSVFVTVTLYKSIHIAQDSERFAKFLLGRFVKFEGPGLVLSVSPIQLIRLSIGDVGTLKRSGFVTFGNVDIPVKNIESLRVGDPVKIDGFNDDGPLLVPSSVKPTTMCPKCGHTF